MKSLKPASRCKSACHGRNGLLFLGAFREVLVISGVAAVLLTGIFNSGLVQEKKSQAKEEAAFRSTIYTVRNIELDRDRQAIFVHSWPNHLCEIDLQTGAQSDLPTPEAPMMLICATASDINSVRVTVSASTDASRYPKLIEVTRNDELILSKECPRRIGTLSDLDVSSAGTVVALVGDDGVVVGIDLTSGAFTDWQFKLPFNIFVSRLSPDGRLLFVSDGQLNSAIHDFRTGSKVWELPLPPGCSRTPVWSSNGERLAVSVSTGSVHVFETQHWNLIWRRELEFMFARSLALSDDGQTLAIGGFGKQIQIWDLNKSTAQASAVIGESGVIHNLKFTDRSQTLITGIEDGSINEWSVSTGRLLRNLR